MRIAPTFLGSMVLLAVASPAANAQNLVTNPGFETGNFSGWSTFGSMDFTGVDGINPHSGSYAAYFGQTDSNGGIYQALTTAPGTFYTFSFWLTNRVAGDNFFAAYWNGTEIYSLSNADPFGYVLLSFDLPATASSSEIRFESYNFADWWDLDDVSVIASATQPGATVPEPGTMTLMAIGLAGIAARRRKQAH